MITLIARNVKSKLEKKVHGKISCHVLGGNTIVCDIIHKQNIFRYTEKYTKQEVINGLSSQEISEKILYAYISSIRKKFFK